MQTFKFLVSVVVPLATAVAASSTLQGGSPKSARYGGPFVIRPKILARGPQLEIGNKVNQAFKIFGWTFTNLDPTDPLVLFGGEDHDLVIGTGTVQSGNGKTTDLRDLGGISAADALRALTSKDPYQRARGVWALGSLGDNQAVGTLSQAMKDGDWLVRRYALLSLWQKADPKQALSFALSSMGDQSDDVVLLAIRVLRSVGAADSRAQSALVKQIAHPGRGVAVAAIEALGEIGDKSVLGALQTAQSTKSPLTEVPLQKAITKIQQRAK